MVTSMRETLRAISEKVQKIQTENSREAYSKLFDIHSDFIGFKGHFPTYPILPGIVQVMMAEITISEALQRECTILEIKKGKFVKPIEPEHTVCAKVYHIKDNIWDCELYTTELAGHFRLECITN